MIKGTRTGNLAAVIRAGHFEILSGVLQDQGGTDDGPSPHELVEAALAACTIITIQMYANRKEWPLEGTDVEVKITSEDKSGTVFQRDISFRGQLNGEQRTRLFEIANKCPIHRLLIGKVEVISTLKNH
jgi:putative redox protein